MKITFVHAPEDYYDQNYGTQFIPLWAHTLAAHAPNHWEVEIIDCRLEEIDEHYQRGITQFQFACDNFIGDTKWAEACCDALLA